MKNAIFILIFCCIWVEMFAQSVWMHPNKGQWDGRILYKIDLNQGEMYLERDGFTYFLHNAKDHHQHDKESTQQHALEHHAEIKGHVIQSKFIGSSWNNRVNEKQVSSFYRNYFLGTDTSKWRADVKSVGQVEYLDFYPGIDLWMDGSEDRWKYSFQVAPFSDASLIQFDLVGANDVFIDEAGKLHATHQFGEIMESAPVAWTIANGRKREVKVEFRLVNNRVSFGFPDGYDSTALLVIDPYLVFSTFTGATADNWGFTAAPDPLGNVFAGGIVFSAGYPTTPGAFDVTYNTGTENGFNIDVTISKFNALGTALLYSTYLGGNKNETPNSIVSSPTGELYVFGVTSSTNFPMTPTSYDNSFNGGPTVTENSIPFSGTDIYITRFNANGTALLGSTYIGGNGNDGLNTSILNYNYGDQFRGEIILDPAGNVYVASSSQSTNFPVLSGSQGSLSGAQDAVIFKMNAGLSTLLWSTYFGGSANETGNSLQVGSNGSVYVAGGTTSSNLPITQGNDLTYNGGLADGYLARFNGTTGAIQAGTYMGMGEYDQTYFVQLDLDDNAYVFGQSQSAWAITPGCYGTANSGQFIRKYTPNLLTINWTTMIGGGSGNVEISPTAFLVSDCYEIYLSGWGGSINQSSAATNSTTFGFQCTPDAFQLNTNGSNFYVAVLAQNATSLKYATYMGGTTTSFNHVDGGTSRFDKSGRMYHAVCGACGGNDFGFTSTPGVWSPTNNSTNCNLAVFKFELNSIQAALANPLPLVCLPSPISFSNSSTNGNAFLWLFGDGNTSTALNPSHVYANAGTYDVTLIVSDTNGCFSPDSVTVTVNIGDFSGGVVNPDVFVCPGQTAQLEAYGGATYLWSPANLLSNATIPNPVATVTGNTVFTVVVGDSCGTDTLQIAVSILGLGSAVSSDTTICAGDDVPLFASGGIAYNWSPSLYLSNPTSANPIATPPVTTEYFVSITTVDGCVVSDSVTITVYQDVPNPTIPPVVQMCDGSTATITVSGATTYTWSPNYQINTLTGPTVVVSPLMDFTYYCAFTNACGTEIDSVLVNVISPTISAGNDTIVCPGESAGMWASGGVSYTWSPAASLNNAFGATVIATPNVSTIYTVIGTDPIGCTDSAFVEVELFPLPFVQTSPNVYAVYGDVIQLNATSPSVGVYSWSPPEFLSCATCTNPTTAPNQNITYTVTFTDENGCQAKDQVKISYDPIIYIPNTFTPDGNQFNQGFKMVASNIVSFELNIYNRWGELIYTMTDESDYWDGSYNGQICQDGTYIWKLTYTDFFQRKDVLNGHVNLIR